MMWPINEPACSDPEEGTGGPDPRWKITTREPEGPEALT